MSDSAQDASVRFPMTPWLLMGLLLLLVALIVRAPASLLQKVVPAGSPARVTDWGGTVWAGQAAWRQETAQGLLRWTVSPWWLLAGRMQADVRSAGAVPLQGRVTLGPGRLQLQGLQGEIPTAVLQALLPQGWQLPGVVRARGFGVGRQGVKQGDWTLATGELAWEGGVLQLVLNQQVQQMTLPPVRIVPQLEGGALVLVMSEASSGMGLAQLRLLANGQVETQVRERLLRYNPTYRSSGTDPDAVVVTTRSAN